MLENGLAAAPSEESLITHEDVGGPQLAGFYVREEAVGLGKGPHSEALQEVAHQRARKFPAETFPRGRAFFEKAGQFP